ncbi:hypothetical protein DPMN_163068 [Dreissena polymorpha]|uniref:Uncharacterized protein n=1 Tax=Dreissena polymorpha TaxID=45954 RepID=A0A9D4EQI1_DREPO|nr:hypothetical protein DPMN_163068 [Dreissena polymorpha]
MTGFDSNAYFIVWGCTKPSVIANKCADPCINILIRDRFPPPAVLNIIEMSLMYVFGLRLTGILRVPHTNNRQCLYFVIIIEGLTCRRFDIM